MSQRTLLYEGSVKNLYRVAPTEIEFEYTDAYSIFDWGRMPDHLTGKGKALAAMGCKFFEELANPASWRGLKIKSTPCLDDARDLKDLQQHGLRTHYLGSSSPHSYRVSAVDVEKPEEISVGGQLLYYYGPAHTAERLIPLEVVFRWGMPAGSSLKDRLTPTYIKALGLDHKPREDETFPFPVIEFFTKLEESDRFLTWEQALNYSRLQPHLFRRMLNRTALVAWWLKNYFEQRGLELLDGKLEWGLSRERLILVDSIGPDELRLREPQSEMPLSKEFLRNLYRPTPWFDALKEAKLLAQQRGTSDWKTIAMKELGVSPRPLSLREKTIAEDLYVVLAQSVTASDGAAIDAARFELQRLGNQMKACLTQGAAQ